MGLWEMGGRGRGGEEEGRKGGGCERKEEGMEGLVGREGGRRGMGQGRRERRKRKGRMKEGRGKRRPHAVPPDPFLAPFPLFFFFFNFFSFNNFPSCSFSPVLLAISSSATLSNSYCSSYSLFYLLDFIPPPSSLPRLRLFFGFLSLFN